MILGVPRQHSLFLAACQLVHVLYYREMTTNREIEILFRRLRLYDQLGRRAEGLVRTIRRVMKERYVHARTIEMARREAKAPKGEQWIHEIKYDGYRVQVHLNSGRKKVFTSNGLDWTTRFTEIAGALAIPGQAIIDGEVVVVHEGRTNFSELQAELSAGRQGRLSWLRGYASGDP
jgi:ATP-dependent DNA ligase